MPDSPLRFSRRLLVLGVGCLALAGAFWVGHELGRAESDSLAGVHLAASDLHRLNVRNEIDVLRARLEDSERQRSILERTQQIDLESTRVLKDQLKQALDDQLDLNRTLSYLKRLVQNGGDGVVQVRGLRLIQGKDSREFQYSFAITQLIPGFGQSRGIIRFSVEGIRGGKVSTLSLSELPAAAPHRLDMDFEHFQDCSGKILLPDGFTPKSVIIGIEPSTKSLLPTSQVFPWELAAQ